MKRFAAVLSVLAIPLAAQQPKQLNVVSATIPGRIVVPPKGNWKPSRVDLYDNGLRPVFTFEDPATHLSLSLILFPNNTGQPTAESCRKDVLDSILQNLESSSVLKNKKFDTRVTPSGTTLATASYLITNLSKLFDSPLQQENIYGFLGNAETCAEIHLSKTNYTPADLPLLAAALDQFTFDADYQPTSNDYTVLASIYVRDVKNYPAAAVYYQRALDTLPASQPPNTTLRRFLTDQLSMSYGIAGNLKQSRAVNEHAIAIDPDYPLYYYNLACADAEQGHAADARTHLQQAFDRKANTLPGEQLPNPATDDSILKLEKNKDFWAFVQTLSPQANP